MAGSPFSFLSQQHTVRRLIAEEEEIGSLRGRLNQTSRHELLDRAVTNKRANGIRIALSLVHHRRLLSLIVVEVPAGHSYWLTRSQRRPRRLL
jgi:hypothetical protein